LLSLVNISRLDHSPIEVVPLMRDPVIGHFIVGRQIRVASIFTHNGISPRRANRF
jgi:hypothetical protein